MIEQIAARLRESPPVDPAARERVMEAVRLESPPRRRASMWRDALGWFLRPRVVRIPPLAPITALAAAIIIGVVVLRQRTPRAQSAPAIAAVDSARARLVQFVLVAQRAQSVAIVGDFNAWDRATTPLASSANGVWSVEMKLTPGRHEYAFIVDGHEWVADPAAARAPADDFGVSNSVVLVGDSQ